MKIRSHLLGLALLGAIASLGFACGGPTKPPASFASPLLDKQLPEFKRPAVDGATTVDTVAARGKVVVVKFFAKYCEPCKRTLPEAEALHKEMPDVLFIGVAEDEHESDAQEMIRQYGLTFPVVHDRSNVLSGRFRVSDMPMTFVADKQGQIRWVGGAGQTGDDLKSAIDSAGQ